MGRPRKYATHADKLRAYREANREAHNAKRREWAAANPEKRRESCRKWRENNKHKIKIPQRTKEEDLARKKRERAKNPERFRASEIKIRAKRALAAGSFSAADIREIRSLQGNKCAMCKVVFAKSAFHVDHIVPLARGGTNFRTNIQLLCATCNISKGAKDPLVYARECGLLL